MMTPDIVNNILNKQELKEIPYYTLVKICAECDTFRESALEILKQYDNVTILRPSSYIETCEKKKLYITRSIDSGFGERRKEIEPNAISRQVSESRFSVIMATGICINIREFVGHYIDEVLEELDDKKIKYKLHNSSGDKYLQERLLIYTPESEEVICDFELNAKDRRFGGANENFAIRKREYDIKYDENVEEYKKLKDILVEIKWFKGRVTLIKNWFDDWVFGYKY